MTAPVTNISCYAFAPLDGLKPLRTALIARCHELALKGTILLSTEGINLFVAGPRDAIDALVAYLRAIPGLAGLAPKFSTSAHQPFSRMLVRIKKEIIAFGVPGIDPAGNPTPKLAARTLKQWLDEGRPITLLDTRNTYEVRLGTFENAVATGIDHFRDFPAAARALPASLKEQTIVTFCTGGIRCEKAGPFLQHEGFKNVLQLEGGILKYFEEVGGAHYRGECFVFDQRVGLDPALRETTSTVCPNCLAPLTPEDQAHPDHRPPHACPHCHRPSEAVAASQLQLRHEALHRATHPMPGSEPCENSRPFRIPPDLAGLPLLDCLYRIFPHKPRAFWVDAARLGHLRDRDNRPLPPDRPVTANTVYLHVEPAEIEPDVATDIRVLHEDDAILVLHKPAPLPMHPGGRFRRNTLEHILNTAFAPYHPRPAHRLDANTTGLVICARTRAVAGRLQPQFARGEVEKTYLARVSAHPREDTFACHAPIGDTVERTGARAIDWANGLPAHTEFRVLRRDADGTALLEARPLTGRTNQIRIHLAHLGHPILGDPTYRATGSIGEHQTLPVGAPPMALHAWRITFTHPRSGERVTFQDGLPDWAR